MDFIYHIHEAAVGHRRLNDLQFSFKPVEDENSPMSYHLSDTLAKCVAIAPIGTLHAPHRPLKVAHIFFTEVNGERLYCVFQALGEGLSIAPAAYITLSDTQFTDDNESVCMARTIMGTAMGMILGDARPEIDFQNAFHAAGFTFYFLHQLKEEEVDEAKSNPLPQIGVEDWGITMGRVRLEEIVDTPDDYNAETKAILEWLAKQEKKA